MLLMFSNCHCQPRKIAFLKYQSCHLIVYEANTFVYMLSMKLCPLHFPILIWHIYDIPIKCQCYLLWPLTSSFSLSMNYTERKVKVIFICLYNLYCIINVFCFNFQPSISCTFSILLCSAIVKLFVFFLFNFNFFFIFQMLNAIWFGCCYCE